MVQKTRILFAGATGYIGGSVLSRFIDHPKRTSFALTAIVRSPEKAYKLRSLGLDIEVAIGSTVDPEFLSNLAADSDVVINATGDDDLDSVENILKGLKRRHHETGTVPIFIHTSSTGIVADRAAGMYASNEIYSDLDINKIWSLSPATGAQHQFVNKPIINADAQGYTRSYIICPSVIVGSPSGKLSEAGIQNQHVLCGMLFNVARECGGPRVVGKGRNICGLVSIADVADLYLRLFDSIAQNRSSVAHGRDGIYFANTVEFNWFKFSTKIGEVLVKHGEAQSSIPQPYTKQEMQKYFTPLYASALGSNVRVRADRSRRLGWKPTSTEEQLCETVLTALKEAAKA
ncbi:NAD(P)-binding protein [Phlegmacium glaucopus]|nr:NAD(P)-binding protein [Phlegmacium glaucopus]